MEGISSKTFEGARISAISIRRVLKIDFELKPYKKIIESSFSDGKFFDIDGVYNCYNERVWAINRADADEKGDVMQK